MSERAEGDMARNHRDPLCARCRCRHKAHDEKVCRMTRFFVMAMQLANPSARFIYHEPGARNG